jgi:hypothetical protein
VNSKLQEQVISDQEAAKVLLTGVGFHRRTALATSFLTVSGILLVCFVRHAPGPYQGWGPHTPVVMERVRKELIPKELRRGRGAKECASL